MYLCFVFWVYVWNENLCYSVIWIIIGVFIWYVINIFMGNVLYDFLFKNKILIKFICISSISWVFIYNLKIDKNFECRNLNKNN